MPNKTLASFADQHLLPHVSVSDFTSSIPDEEYVSSGSCPELYSRFVGERFASARTKALKAHDEKIPMREAPKPTPLGLSMGWRDVRDRAKQQDYATKKINKRKISMTLSPREQGILSQVEAHMAQHGCSATAACKALSMNTGNYYGAKVKRDGPSRPSRKISKQTPRDSELAKAQPVDSTKPSYRRFVPDAEPASAIIATPTGPARVIGSLAEEKSSSRVKVIIVEGTREDVLAVLKEALR